jgi:hypothetical protein
MDEQKIILNDKLLLFLENLFDNSKEIKALTSQIAKTRDELISCFNSDTL